MDSLEGNFFIVHALFKADFFGLEKIRIDSIAMATYTLSFTHFDKSMSLCTLLARDTTLSGPKRQISLDQVFLN